MFNIVWNMMMEKDLAPPDALDGELTGKVFWLDRGSIQVRRFLFTAGRSEKLKHSLPDTKVWKSIFQSHSRDHKPNEMCQNRRNFPMHDVKLPYYKDKCCRVVFTKS